MRSTTLPGSPYSTNNVSHMLRAGWSVGMFRACEVVPVGLGLGTFGDGEAEPDEHVLEPLVGLGHEVGVASRRPARELGEVEALGGQAGATIVGGELGPALLELALDARPAPVQRPAPRWGGRRGRAHARRCLSVASAPRLPSSSVSSERSSSRVAAALMRAAGVGSGPGRRRRSSGRA